MAELNISERQAGDITILDMDGKVTIGEGSVALRSDDSPSSRRRQKENSFESRQRRLC